MEPLTIEQRLAAGPPTLRTVARVADVGDLIWSRRDGQIHEITVVHPAIVGQPGYEAVSLLHREPVTLARRDAVVLTQAEAAAAREHLERTEEGCPDCGQDTLAQEDPDDDLTTYCTDVQCGWRN